MFLESGINSALKGLENSEVPFCTVGLKSWCNSKSATEIAPKNAAQLRLIYECSNEIIKACSVSWANHSGSWAKVVGQLNGVRIIFFFFSPGAFARMWKAKRGTVYTFILLVIIIFLVMEGKMRHFYTLSLCPHRILSTGYFIGWRAFARCQGPSRNSPRSKSRSKIMWKIVSVCLKIHIHLYRVEHLSVELCKNTEFPLTSESTRELSINIFF